jgi:asparagine synthase (glutamine-hydrolysing)
MCGIAGIIDLRKPVDPVLIRQMTEVIAHRGPDADGYYIEEGIGLGHRRLSIIDLKTGGQPIHNEDRSVWIIFNGEIYNYRELTASLKKTGHRFYTEADTETIVHLYEDYGDDCVRHLRGMFAFALWDTKKRRLLLARDRVGKKPLAYCHIPGRLVFGSEIKSILCDNTPGSTISREAIDQYLTFGYIAAPDTIYDHIKKLQPGHLLTYENDCVTTRRYWDLKFTGDGPDNEGDVIRQIERLLLEAIELRLISDVPLGAFLSGGVDSSLVVGMMSKLSPRPVKTFTIGFEEGDFSEIKYARLVAKHLGTEHYEEILKPDILNVMETLLYQYDEPFADSSMIPTYLVSKLARSRVTVALTGDGGDEIFAGYNRYTNLSRARKLDHIPGFRLAATTISHLPLISPSLRKKLRILAEPGGQRQLALSSITSRAFRRKLYTEQFHSALDNDRRSRTENLYLSNSEQLSQWQYRDIHAYLPNDILVKIDRASMAASLETRAPLLDDRLIEFMATVPERLKTKNNIGKYLLKKLAEQYIPNEVIYRKKMGFMIPAGRWFRGPLRQAVEENLLSDKACLRALLRQDVIRSILREHLNSHMDHSAIIYSLLYLELWLKRYSPNVG